MPHNDFWPGSHFSLLQRDARGWLVPTEAYVHTLLARPELALVPRGQNQFVFVARDDGKGGLVAERRQVTTGARWQGKVEITGGLQMDEQVVTHGTVKVRDQMPISVLPDQSEAR